MGNEWCEKRNFAGDFFMEMGLGGLQSPPFAVEDKILLTSFIYIYIQYNRRTLICG